MKPDTFADLLLSGADDFLKGYKTSADNEKGAQEKIDVLLKQRFGVSLEHHEFGGTKIRENTYQSPQNRGKIADFAFIVDKTERNTFILKETEYYIELKTESGGTKGRFSGMTWKAAFRSDIEKLQPAAQSVTYKNFLQHSLHGGPRVTSRCFAVLIAFHPDTSAKIISSYAADFPESVCRVAISDPYSVCILVKGVK